MTALLLFVGLLLLFANAAFVAAEFAVVAARESRLQQLAGRDPRARAALSGMRNVTGTLAATQLGITMASIGLGFTAEAAVEASLAPLVGAVLPLAPEVVDAVGIAAALAVVAAAHILLGEMVPKNLAVAAPLRTALWLLPPVRAFSVLVRPAVVALAGAAAGLLRLVGLEPQAELRTGYDVRDIGDMLEIAEREGSVGRAEQELLGRAVEFARRTASEIMVPWSQVTSVEEGTPVSEVERVAVASQHSRLPVRRGPEVVGFVHVLDLPAASDDPPVRPLLEVRPGARLVDVFDQLRQHSHDVAVVREEASEPLGIVTLGDLVDDLLGQPSP
jgi:CBS domain containing-hemolysin-like protein